MQQNHDFRRLVLTLAVGAALAVLPLGAIEATAASGEHGGDGK
jgi:hypothetical protein